MKPYPVPAQEIRRELTISNSRFISTLSPAFSIEEAKAFILRIKAEFPRCVTQRASIPDRAWRFGDRPLLGCRCEPSGTAGRPALAVLRGSGLGDVAVVVTRYFGGTKLGTGGLVRAYSDAVRLVVDNVPRRKDAHPYRHAGIPVHLPGTGALC